MTSQISAERQTYFKKVEQLMLEERYLELLAFEGEEANSQDFKQRAFANYQPSKSDIIVTTYPKSGTNWTMQMGQQIAWRGESDFDFIHDIIPWPDSLMKTPVVSLDAKIPESPTGYRVIKSHLEAEFIPYSPDAKYIVMIRDPKEVVVSAYHFQNGFFEKMIGSGIPLPSYVEGFVTKNFIFSGWAEHTAGWWQRRELPNVLILFFHEMKSDLKNGIDQISAFLEVELTEEERAQVIDKCSYQYMKGNNHKFSPPTPADYQSQGKIAMIRSGKAGQVNLSLSIDQQRWINQFCSLQLTDLNSDFPYMELYSNANSL